jgi:hypothetical protein
MRTREVIQSIVPFNPLSDINDHIIPGWRIEITPRGVTATIPEGHWARVAAGPPRADGRSLIDADIDDMATVVARYLKSVVNAQKETA